MISVITIKYYNHLYSFCSQSEREKKKMARSLIKTVDGIGIWVRDDTTDLIISWKVIFTTLIIILSIFPTMWYIYGASAYNDDIMCMLTFVYPIVCGFVFIKIFDLPAYKVYAGSDDIDGIYIIKTNDEKADQIAICKAAKEIEARCHEISKKRAELDRIAGNCK
jgi:hypothetical protein